MSKVDLDDSWWNGVMNGLTNGLTNGSNGHGGVQNASFKIAAKQCINVRKLSDEKDKDFQSRKQL